MSRKRYQPEENVSILREAERTSIKDTCRHHNVSEQTYFRWKRMYGGLGTPDIQKMKQMEKENRQLKQLAGDQALAIQVMKEEMEKKGWI